MFRCMMRMALWPVTTTVRVLRDVFAPPPPAPPPPTPHERRQAMHVVGSLRFRYRDKPEPGNGPAEPVEVE